MDSPRDHQTDLIIQEETPSPTRWHKAKSLGKALLWILILALVFMTAGYISDIFKINKFHPLLGQSSTLLLAISPIAIYLLVRQIKLKGLYLDFKFSEARKNYLYYLLLILILVPMFILSKISPFSELALLELAFALPVGILVELYFRGIIFYSLRRAFNIPAAILLSAAFFTLARIAADLFIFENTGTLVQIIEPFLFGLVFAQLAYLTKNILPLMLLHALYQLSVDGLFFYALDHDWVYIAQGALMLALAVFLLFKVSKQARSELVLREEKTIN